VEAEASASTDGRGWGAKTAVAAASANTSGWGAGAQIVQTSRSINQKNPEIMIWNGGFAFLNRDRSDICQNCWLTKIALGDLWIRCTETSYSQISGCTWDSPGFHLHRFASGKIFEFLQFQACYRRNSWNNCWATMVDWLQAPQDVEQFSINANWKVKSKYPILAFLNYSQLSWKE